MVIRPPQELWASLRRVYVGGPFALAPFPRAARGRGVRRSLTALGEELVLGAGMDWAVGGDLGFDEGLIVRAGRRLFLWLFDAWIEDCVPGADDATGACRAGHLAWAADIEARYDEAVVGWVPGDGVEVYGVGWALVPLRRLGGREVDVEWSRISGGRAASARKERRLQRPDAIRRLRVATCALYEDDPEHFVGGCADISYTLWYAAQRLGWAGIEIVSGTACPRGEIEPTWHVWLRVHGRCFDPTWGFQCGFLRAPRAEYRGDVLATEKERIDTLEGFFGIMELADTDYWDAATDLVLPILRGER